MKHLSGIVLLATLLFSVVAVVAAYDDNDDYWSYSQYDSSRYTYITITRTETVTETELAYGDSAASQYEVGTWKTVNPTHFDMTQFYEARPELNMFFFIWAKEPPEMPRTERQQFGWPDPTRSEVDQIWLWNLTLRRFEELNTKYNRSVKVFAVLRPHSEDLSDPFYDDWAAWWQFFSKQNSTAFGGVVIDDFDWFDSRENIGSEPNPNFEKDNLELLEAGNFTEVLDAYPKVKFYPVIYGRNLIAILEKYRSRVAGVIFTWRDFAFVEGFINATSLIRSHIGYQKKIYSLIYHGATSWTYEPPSDMWINALHGVSYYMCDGVILWGEYWNAKIDVGLEQVKVVKSSPRYVGHLVENEMKARLSLEAIFRKSAQKQLGNQVLVTYAVAGILLFVIFLHHAGKLLSWMARDKKRIFVDREAKKLYEEILRKDKEKTGD